MAGKVGKVAVVLAVAVGLAMLLVPAGEAEAYVCAGVVDDRCSLPYVSDVNPYGKKYMATVEVAGEPKVVKAYIGKKRVKIDRIGERTWMLPMKKGKLYTIKAKSARSGWKVIQYKIVKV